MFVLLSNESEHIARSHSFGDQYRSTLCVIGMAFLSVFNLFFGTVFVFVYYINASCQIYTKCQAQSVNNVVLGTKLRA